MGSRNPLVRFLTVFFLAIIVLVEVFPYVWIAITSLKDLPGVLRFPPSLLPFPPHWENYVQAWQSGPFVRYFVNSFITTFSILLIQLFLACLAGYAFSKLSFPGRDVCFYIVVSCLMVPPQVRFVPIYIMMAKVGLLNTYASLILPYAASALGTFLIREAFASISDRILDAARIDGANVIQIIFRIMVPIAKPTIIAFSLFSVVFHWNDYFWPLVMTTNESVRTLPLGVALLREEGTGARWHIIMAGNMFVLIPMVLAFLAAQRQFIRGLTIGGVKG
jgi:sn-glycerol 3-phosphate transport system permease protein